MHREAGQSRERRQHRMQEQSMVMNICAICTLNSPSLNPLHSNSDIKATTAANCQCSRLILIADEWLTKLLLRLARLDAADRT